MTPISLRLIFRRGISDGNGTHVGYQYETAIVEIPPQLLIHEDLRYLEVIGGEWICREEENESQP